MAKITIHSAFHPHKRVGLDPGQGRTKQSFAEESNINVIMAKYEKTQMLTHLNTHQGNYGSFIGYADYHTSMNAIRLAEEMFMAIPATTRAEFDNDPARFLEFVQDEKNHDRMVELGLAYAKPSEVPPGAEPASPVTRVPDDPPPAPQEPENADK